MKRMAFVWGTLCGILLLSAPTAMAAKEVGPAVVKKAQLLEFSGQLQFRYVYIEKEDGADDPVSGFDWRRVRLYVAGDLTDRLYFKLGMGFEDLPDEFGLQTTALGFRLGPFGNIEIGRFTTNAFHRPSSKRMLFVERTRHVTRNNPGSERGIYYDVPLLKKRAFLELGMFNGNGDASLDDKENDNFLYMAHFGAATAKKFGFTTEGDLKHSAWQAGVSGGGWYHKAGPADEEEKISMFGGAIQARGKGLYAAASYSRRRVTGDTVDDYTAKGWDVKTSYAIALPWKGNFIEPAVRYERYEDPGRAGKEDEDIAWTYLGVNYYMKSHDAKFQANYILKDERGDARERDNDTFMVQAQLLF